MTNLINAVPYLLCRAPRDSLDLGKNYSHIVKQSLAPEILPDQQLDEVRPMSRSLVNAILGQGKLKARDVIGYFKHLLTFTGGGSLSKALDSWSPFEQRLQKVSNQKELIDLSDDVLTKFGESDSILIRGGYGTSQTYLRNLSDLDEYAKSIGSVLSDLTHEGLNIFPGEVKEAVFEHFYQGSTDKLANDVGVLLRGLFPSKHVEDLIDVVVDQLKQEKTLEEAFQKGLQTALLSKLDEERDFVSGLLGPFSPGLIDGLKERGVAKQEQPVWYKLSRSGNGYELDVHGISNGEVFKLNYKMDAVSKELIYQLLAFRKMPQITEVSYSFDDIRTYLNRSCSLSYESKKARSTDQMNEQRLIMNLIEDCGFVVDPAVIQSDARLAQKTIPQERVVNQPGVCLPSAVKELLLKFVKEAGIHPAYIEIAMLCIDRALGPDAAAAARAICKELLPSMKFVPNRDGIGLVNRYLDYQINQAEGWIKKEAWHLAKLILSKLSASYLPENLQVLVWHLELQLAKVVLPIIAQLFVWHASKKEEWKKQLVYFKDLLTREGKVDLADKEYGLGAIQHFWNEGSPLKQTFDQRDDRVYYQKTSLFISSEQWINEYIPFSNYLVLEDSCGKKSILIRENLSVSASMNLLHQLTGAKVSAFVESQIRAAIESSTDASDVKENVLIQFDLREGKLTSADPFANAYLVFSYLTQGKIALAEQAFDKLKSCVSGNSLPKDVSLILKKMLPLVFLLKDHSAYVLQLKMLALCEQLDLPEKIGVWDYVELGVLEGIMECYLSSIKQGLSSEDEEAVLKMIERRIKHILHEQLPESIPSQAVDYFSSYAVLPEIKKRKGYGAQGPIDKFASSQLAKWGFQQLDEQAKYRAFDCLGEEMQDGDHSFNNERNYDPSSLIHLFPSFYLLAKERDSDLNQTLEKLHGIGTYHPTAAMIHDVLLDVLDNPDAYPTFAEVDDAFNAGSLAVQSLFEEKLLDQILTSKVQSSILNYFNRISSKSIQPVARFALSFLVGS